MTKDRFLLLLIAAGLLGALISFAHRFSVEAHNREVELVVDWADVQALANTTSQETDAVLAQLKAAGITTVAINEDTLNMLWSNGVLTYRRQGNSRDGKATTLVFTPGFADQRQRVFQMLHNKSRLRVIPGADGNTLTVSAPWPQFNGLPIGLDDDTVRAVRRNGLLITPRLLNFTGTTAENIAWELAQTRRQCTPDGMGPLIFSGAAVLGYRAQIPATARALAGDNLNLLYGSVEFGKMFGDDELARRAAAQTVRVHSIGTDEIGLMDEPTAVERFVRGARERNIRVCYVRLFVNGLADDPDVIHANTEFIGKIVAGLREARLTPGQAHAFAPPHGGDPTPGLVLRLLMALGVVGGALLLLRVFFQMEGPAFQVLLAGALLLGLASAVPHVSPKGRELLALTAACIFPTLGLCYPARPLTSPAGLLPALATGPALRRAFLSYARISLATLAGILLVVGLLSGRLFLLKVDEFLGVKAILVGPVLLVGLFYFLGLAALGPDAGWDLRRARMMHTVRQIAGRPLLIGQMVGGVAALVVLIVFVARSGNDPGVGVSPTERTVRALLDHYLLVRPRTKEFLLGHPALFFALAAAWSGRFRPAIVPLLVVGAIGQASLLDTFCHLHTPLFLSLLRGLIGWLLGAGIGALAFVIASRLGRPAGSPEPVPVPVAEAHR